MEPIQGLTIDSIISALLSFAVWAAGLLSIVFIIVSGFFFITSGGNPDGIKKGKSAITYAIIEICVIY